MYAQFRAQYPMGSLTSELLQAQEGYFLVRAMVQVGGVVLATGLSAAATIEQAEDQARVRALTVLGIEQPSFATQAHLLESMDAAAGDSSPARLNPATQDELLPMSDSLPTPTATAPDWVATDAAPPMQTLDPAPAAAASTQHGSNGKRHRPGKARAASPPLPTPSGDRRAAVSEAASVPVDLSDIIAQTDVELKRLGWTSTQGRKYLQQTYDKRSRQQLTDDELLEFLHHLESQPSKDEPPF